MNTEQTLTTPFMTLSLNTFSFCVVREKHHVSTPCTTTWSVTLATEKDVRNKTQPWTDADLFVFMDVAVQYGMPGSTPTGIV